MHLHLDPVGGVAGDMFAAALLDAFPHLGAELVPALRAAGLAHDVDVRWHKVEGEVLAGTHFVVDDPREKRGARPPHHAVLGAHAGEHAHVRYVDIRDRIARSALPPGAVTRALDILLHLARAEAGVHGIASVEDVTFHEVGAQDSIADVVAAAFLVDRAGVRSTSIASIPIGQGQVKTAHGMLPVPSPATALLLAGMRTHDDGLLGERTTPTGAAIVKHLAPAARKPTGRLGAVGTGWGTKRFAGVPNVLRVLGIEPDVGPGIDPGVGPGPTLERDALCRLSFEVDDQSAEDLAIALAHLRALDGVLDVLQAPAYGKKGRLVTSVQLLCTPASEERALRACLLETTTLGVRVEHLERVALPRTHDVVDGRRVKRATRPDGTITTKIESDELMDLDTQAARARVRHESER